MNAGQGTQSLGVKAGGAFVVEEARMVLSKQSWDARRWKAGGGQYAAGGRHSQSETQAVGKQLQFVGLTGSPLLTGAWDLSGSRDGKGRLQEPVCRRRVSDVRLNGLYLF